MDFDLYKKGIPFSKRFILKKSNNIDICDKVVTIANISYGKDNILQYRGSKRTIVIVAIKLEIVLKQ